MLVYLPESIPEDDTCRTLEIFFSIDSCPESRPQTTWVVWGRDSSGLLSKLESDWSVYDSFSDLFRVRGRAKVRLGLGTY